MINLDPSLVDQDTIRKQRRKRLMTIYAAPVAVLLIIAGFFLSCSFFNLIYSIEYGSKAYDMAENFGGTRLLINWLEPYIAYYDQGVAELIQTKYTKAEENFNLSLQNSPPEKVLCKIYVNLSLSIEYQADEKLSGENYEDALILYNRAEATLYNNGCASEQGSQGKDAKAESAKARIDQKRSKAVAAANNATDSSDNTSETTDNQRRLSDEDIQKIIDEKVPINSLRGQLKSDGTYCRPYMKEKCY